MKRQRSRKLISIIMAVILVMGIIPVNYCNKIYGAVPESAAPAKSKVYQATEFSEALTYTFSGTVTDRWNTPKVNAAVIIGGYQNFTTVTDAAGKFSCELYAGEEYSAIIRSDGEKDYIIPVINYTGNTDIGLCVMRDDTYKISAEEITNGTVSLSSQYNIATGTVVNAAITADEGYVIDKIRINGAEQSFPLYRTFFDYSFDMPQEDIAIAVECRKLQLEFTYDSAVGKITGNSDRILNGTELIDYNTSDYTYTVSAADDRYHINKLTVDGQEVPEAYGLKTYTDTFYNITMDKKVTAEFEKDEYEITINTQGDGSVYYMNGENWSELNNGEVHIASGDDFKLKINPGYNRNVEMKVDGEAVNGMVEDAEGGFLRTLNNIRQNHNIEIIFTECTVNDSVSYTITCAKKNDDTKSVEEYQDIIQDEKNNLIVRRVAVTKGEPVRYTISPDNAEDFIKVIFNSLSAPRINSDETTKIENMWLYRDCKFYNVPFNKPILLVIDTDKPRISPRTVKAYYKNGDKIELDVKDIGDAGIRYVRCSMQSEAYNEDTYEKQAETSYLLKYDDGTALIECNVNESGKYIYYVWSYDYAGNKSAMQTIDVRIDKDSPVIHKAETDNDKVGSQDVTVSIKAGDILENGGSGFAEVCYSTDNEAAVSDKYNEDIGRLVKRAEYDEAEDKYYFTISSKENQSVNELYYIWAYDKAGNKSDLTEIQIVIDRERPVLEQCSSDKNGEWTNKSVTVSGYISDKGGSESVILKYSTDKSDFDNNTQTGNEKKLDIKNEKGSYEYSLEFEDSFGGEYYFWTIDSAGNRSDICVSVIVKTDKINPVIKEYAFASGSKINSCSFGLFCNDTIKVRVKADDKKETGQPSSGIKKIKLYKKGNGEGGDILLEEQGILSDGTAEFELKEGFSGAVYAVAEDKAGNISAVDEPEGVKYPTEIFMSENKTGYIMIEKNKPVIQSVITNLGGFRRGEDIFYKENVKVDFSMEDKEGKNSLISGLKKADITVITPDGGSSGKNVVYEKFDTYKKAGRYTVDTKKVSAKDGKYIITAHVFDNAGNEAEEEEITVYKDSTAPKIVKFDFVTQGNKLTESAKDYTPQKKSYGYYFTKDTQVVITAEDINSDKKTSGVKSITYYTVDTRGKVMMPKTVDVNDKNQIVVNIPKDFKGQIYAKASDNVGNSSAFVTPSSIIIESDKKHNQEEHIAFSKNKTDCKDISGIDLYANDTEVSVTVTDTYSGIWKLEWWVTAPCDTGNNQSGSVELKNDGTFVNGNSNGWIQTKTENNLVTQMKKSILVNNNSNNITVHVKMTDRAGNISESETKISIDKTMPVYTVIYDNNSADNRYSDVYNGDRTATIVVTERNFDEKDFIAAITNTDGVIPKMSAWTEIVDSVNQDNTKYTATIRYCADGDYEFGMELKDMAGNKAAVFEKQQFTIDKTVPVVTVDYNNYASLNGNYYNSSRSAVVTVTEHNFDASRIRIIGTAINSQTLIEFPVTGVWSSNGDVHRTVINYKMDGFYTFDIECMDMAGNVSNDYAAEQFYIDKTSPSLEITEVEENHSYSHKKLIIAPVITFCDENYNPSSVKITLTGAHTGEREVTGKFEDIPNGQIFHMDNIEYIRENDDIYTVTAYMSDMAGNEISKSVTFSINRFGSSYVIDGNALKFDKKFVRSTEDIVITEVNVARLYMNQISVVLVKNGIPSGIVKGEDYTVKESGGNGEWYQYEYRFDKALFEDDATYMILLRSVDEAFNRNESDVSSKNAKFSFGIDKTNPVIIPLNIEKGKIYLEKKKKAVVHIKDNFAVVNVEIFLNGEPVKYTENKDNYFFEIMSSNKKQVVKVIAEDVAGNKIEMKIEDILISTNPIVRWYNNKVSVMITLLGLILCAIFFQVVYRRKNDMYT